MAKPKNQDALDLLAADYKHAGRHRARKTAKDRWIEFAWLTLASVVLSSSGYLGLQYAVSSMATPKPVQRIVNGVDLNIPITVIDASGTRKYASPIGQKLLDGKLVVPYSRTLDFTFEQSTIQIKKEEYRGLAKRIQLIVGELPIVLKKDSKYPVEVRLGTDFEPKTPIN
jgi:hypothetical protein